MPLNFSTQLNQQHSGNGAVFGMRSLMFSRDANRLIVNPVPWLKDHHGETECPKPGG